MTDSNADDHTASDHTASDQRASNHTASTRTRSPHLGEHREDEALLRFCHDLRQQVATGRLLADLCRDAPPGGGDPADAEACIDSLAQVIEDLEAMIAAEVGEVAGLWEVDLDEIVQRCVSQARLALGARIILHSKGAITAYCDPVKMRRAIANVLDNAVRASGVEGQVVVELHGRRDHTVLSIRDDGPGFARIGSVTGFGMVVVSEAAREAGGSLHISTGPAPGTTVELRLPRHHREESA